MIFKFFEISRDSMYVRYRCEINGYHLEVGVTARVAEDEDILDSVLRSEVYKCVQVEVSPS